MGPENMDGPKWQQADSIIGVNPGVGLRPRNTDARIDSQMFVLEQGDTNKDNHYGFVAKKEGDKVEPSIFIKLNTIWGWTPKPYDCAAEKAKGDESDGPCLPEVEEHINAQGADAANNVYVNCRGRYAADQEALKDGLTYFPANRGLPIKYFPYQGKGKMAGGNYHAPLVAVKISPREGHEGQLIHIECRAYYDGVKRHQDQGGHGHV